MRTRANILTTASVISVGLGLLASVTPAVAAKDKEVKYVQKASSYDKLAPAKKGGTLYEGIADNPKVLNPIISTDQTSRVVEPYLWATLFTEDMNTLEPLPYLAESYSITPDRKTYTFVLNPDATWEDGTKVTTDDVKFSFDTMMNPKTLGAAAARSYWEGVQLEVVDPRKFKFSVKEPKFDTLRSLYLFQPIQKKQFENEPDFNKARGILNPIGDGVYRLKAFLRDQRMELERKKDWWGYKLKYFKERFNYDQIVYRVISDPNLEYERFLKGDLDIQNFFGSGTEIFATKVHGTDKDKVGTKPGDGKTVWATEIENKAPRGYDYVGWNLHNPIFQSAKTRTALAYLVDYQQIIDKVYYGYRYQCTSPFGSRTMYSAPDLREASRMIKFNRKKAIELLKEDGWAPEADNMLHKTIDGKKVDFKFTLKFNSNNPLRAKIAQIIKENFKAGGVAVEIRSMEWNAFIDDVDHRNFEALILGWGATPFPNPNQEWSTDSQKNEGSNFVGYSNPKVDEMIVKANLEFDLKKRAKMLQEINRILYADQPYLFLTEPRSMIAGFNKKIRSSVWAMTYDIDPPEDLYTIE